MPRHSKLTKLTRDRALIAAVREHLRGMRVFIAGKVYSTKELVAKFQSHVDALSDVDTAAAAWITMVRREERLERELKAFLHPFKSFVLGTLGEDNPALSAFGFRPKTPPKTSVATKARAVEKRRATRKARGR